MSSLVSQLSFRWATTLLPLLLVIVTGCSGDGHSGEGVVRFTTGQPVQSGSIEFRSRTDESRYASRISPDGEFQLVDADGERGCPAGDYDVVVVQIVWAEDLAAAAHTHGVTVPRRYGDYYTSDLKVTIEPDRDTPLHVVLQPETP